MNKQIVKRVAWFLFAAAAACFFFVLLKLVNQGNALLLGSRKEAPEYVFSYADNQPEDYPTVQGARKFAELVQEKTSGRIRINVFAGGEMGNENEVVEQLQYGGIDFARASVMMLTDIKPKFNVLQLPYLYRDETHMWKVLDGE
ncbi:MAG: TRAP transporter substrate-binding protein DctP, partial [Hungatella sp.]|nr:TRAP transporter substrate-binding protein DctP [Hungatella sp.]